MVVPTCQPSPSCSPLPLSGSLSISGAPRQEAELAKGKQQRRRCSGRGARRQSRRLHDELEATYAASFMSSLLHVLRRLRTSVVLAAASLLAAETKIRRARVVADSLSSPVGPCPLVVGGVIADGPLVVEEVIADAGLAREDGEQQQYATAVTPKSLVPPCDLIQFCSDPLLVGMRRMCWVMAPARRALSHSSFLSTPSRGSMLAMRACAAAPSPSTMPLSPTPPCRRPLQAPCHVSSSPCCRMVHIAGALPAGIEPPGRRGKEDALTTGIH